jgi:hypothetical protein
VTSVLGRSAPAREASPLARRWLAWLLWFFVYLVPTPARATPEKELEEGARAYVRGDFKQAIKRIRPLLYPSIRLSNQEQVVQAYRLLGISYVFEKNKPEAEKQFLAILSIRPRFRLDPLVDPVAAVNLFEAVKKRNADKIKKILERERLERERRQREEARRRAEERRMKLLAQQPQQVVERTVIKRPWWINFVPLGAGQFQNGHRRKGYILLGTQATLAAISAGAGLGVYFGYSGRALNREEYDRARALSITQVVSAGICAAAVVYGVVDALIYHEPQTVTERRYKKKPPTKKKSAHYFLAPTVGPDGKSGGLGLGVVF